jgi:hypothetical protein
MSNNEVITSSFTLPAGSVEYATSKLLKLGKKATKLGLMCPSLKVVKEYTKLIDDVLVLLSEVEVTYQMVVISGGWRFIASLETVDSVDGVSRNKVSGPSLTELDHSKYSTHIQSCEHCNINRKRNKTFIIQSKSETKQVGSTCLRSFLGIDPTAIMDSFNLMNEINEIASECKSSKYSKPIWSLNEVGPVAVSILQQEGFVSSAQATLYDNDKVKTGLSIFSFMNANSYDFKRPSFVTWYNKIKPTEENINRFQAILKVLEDRILPDYINNPTALDSFTFKVGIILNRKAVEANDMQILAAVINREMNSQVIKATKEVKNTELYPCNEGDKLELNVKIEYVKEINGSYGVTLLIKMLNEQGYSFTTFYNGRNSFNQGDSLKIKATVKKLDRNPKFGNTVQLTRIKAI